MAPEKEPLGRKKRGRVELARIEDKTSRQVRFSKRKGGLFKKAFELAVLCDAEVALLVLSPAGRFFEFSSSSCIEKTIKRYQQFMCAQEEANNDRKSKVDIDEAKNKKSKCPSSDITFKLLEFDHWFAHESIDQVEVGALEELEKVLLDALSMTKSKQSAVMARSSGSDLRRSEEKQDMMRAPLNYSGYQNLKVSDTGAGNTCSSTAPQCLLLNGIHSQLHLLHKMITSVYTYGPGSSERFSLR